MKSLELFTSACRHCRFYTPAGRRGGHCQQLDVPVQGKWKACTLSLPPFAPSWEELEIGGWHEEALMDQDVLLVTCMQSESQKVSMLLSVADSLPQSELP